MSRARRPRWRVADELKPMSHATSTSAVCKPMDASRENQTERYKRIPSKVVYQETMESKQLATNSAWTMGRLTLSEFDEANAIAQCSLKRFTRDARRRFQTYSARSAASGSQRTARRAGM